MKQSFLCGRCKRVMCKDCISIADEFQELFDNRTLALNQAAHKIEDAERRAAFAERDSATLKEIMQLGQHKLLLAWMNSLTSQQLLEKVKAA